MLNERFFRTNFWKNYPFALSFFTKLTFFEEMNLHWTNDLTEITIYLTNCLVRKEQNKWQKNDNSENEWYGTLTNNERKNWKKYLTPPSLTRREWFYLVSWFGLLKCRSVVLQCTPYYLSIIIYLVYSIILVTLRQNTINIWFGRAMIPFIFLVLF